MRQEIKEIYQFDELSEEAQQRAIAWYRTGLNDMEIPQIYDEAHETVEKFNEVFNIKNGLRSWLDFDINHQDEYLLGLTGLRLRKYIINNFSEWLFKGKYYSLWSKTEKADNVYGKKLKSRHSKIIFTNDCPLTGMGFDHDMLQPIYSLIEWHQMDDYNSYQTFENLINDCYQGIEQAIEKMTDFVSSEEAIIENIEANDYEFYIDGSKY